jgi:FdhD protein
MAPLRALRVEGGVIRTLDERAAVEVPFELRVNGRSHSLLMISPHNVRELAMGFCISEGLAGEPGQVLGLELGRSELPGTGPVVWADLKLPPDLARRIRRRRAVPAATSCGLCGLESFRDPASDIPRVGAPDFRVELADIFKLVKAMEREQPVFRATGGTHAVCLGAPGGRALCVMEDVGRHNALDKALGGALLAGSDLAGCVVLLSGRVSYEIALKVARAGVPLVGSVSAPTALAVKMLDALGVTLLGFGRHPRANVYTHPRRILVHGQPLPRAGTHRLAVLAP